MSEEPKSIWKRKWTGPRGLFAWFLILAFSSFVIVVCFELLYLRISQSPVAVSLVSSVIVAGAAVLLFAMARWLLSPPNRRRALFGVVCVITLIALFYAEENWRGHHAWQKYKRGLEAKGETVDLAKLAPPPVPDEQNFAMAPIVVESISAQLTNASPRVRNWYGNKIAELDHASLTNYLKMPIELSGRRLTFTNGSGDWRQAQKTNLKEWQEYYRQLATVTNFFPVPENEQTPAEDVLLALSKYDSSVERMRAAAERPYSRFPLGYLDDYPAGILLPHLSVLKQCQQTLWLRTIAEVKSGESDKALEDVKLMFRLTDSIRTESILISHLVRIAMIQLTIQPIWEGLAEHQWTKAQLAEIESELNKLDFLTDYQFAMRGERALGVGVIDYLRLHPREYAKETSVDFDDSLEQLAKVLSSIIPDGWFEQNKLSICRMHSDYLLPIVNSESRSISLANQRRATQAIHNLMASSSPYAWFARLLIPALDKANQRFAHAQASVDLARIACTLERYHLAHGNYPETLDALAPKFLKTIPHDIIGGQPLKYRRANDGQFVLYSVGWNEKDDGGTVAFTKGKTPSVDIRNGDWVWKYPEN